MNLRGALATAAATSVLLLTAVPSYAAESRVTDPRGDAEGPGLDIVAARVENRDYRIVAVVRFVRAVRGDVIVSVDRRRGPGLRMVSEHRPAGETRSFVVPGAFTDRRAAAGAECPGFRVRWLADRPVVRMSLPARCLNSGSYGAVRFAVLTERQSDTDYAPGNPAAPSRWIPRG
jgi:hypothetical protein